MVGKQVWEEVRERSPLLSSKPSPNTIGPHRYVQRIGHLTHGGDHWWRPYASQDPEPLTAEILAVLRDWRFPKLRHEMSDQRPGSRGTFEGIRQDNR